MPSRRTSRRNPPPALAAGALMGLGLITTAAIMAWKRRQSREWFAAGNELPGAAPSKDWRGEVTSWQPAYPAAALAPREAINPTTGNAAHITHIGRFVRGIVEGRVTQEGHVTPHWGIDIAAPVGTPVYAAKGGEVIRSEPITGYGNSVVVQHDDGQSTLYAHLNRAFAIRGVDVHAGQMIGEVGRTAHGPNGRVPRNRDGSISAWPRTMGSHLHMEVHRNSPPVLTRQNPRLDPVNWLRQNRIEMFGERA